MRKIKRTLLWFYMLSKRLFRKYSFLVILLLIPLLFPMANAAMHSESGILKIALAHEKRDNPAAEAIMDTLLKEESILLYTRYDSPEAAREAVATGKADGAWIFAADFAETVEMYAARKRNAPLVTVYEREGTVPLQLAREKLYGAIYPQISYAVYENFIQKSFSPSITAEDRRLYYEAAVQGDDIIQMKKLHGAETASETNYLTAPLRGLLSLIIMLCGLAAAMYYLQDNAAGRFDWLPPEKRILPAMGTCLGACAASGLSVLLALYAAGIFTGFWRETVAMLLFVFAAAGFCLLWAMVFRDAGHLGAMIPFFIIGMLALSPIFFHVQRMPILRHFLPPGYYLKAIHDGRYLIYMLLYSVVVYALACLLTQILYKKIKKS